MDDAATMVEAAVVIAMAAHASAMAAHVQTMAGAASPHSGAGHRVIANSPPDHVVVVRSSAIAIGSATVARVLIQSDVTTPEDSHAGKLVVEPTQKICVGVHIVLSAME